MITKVQLFQGTIGYEYAMIRIWRDNAYKDYQYSNRWTQLLAAMHSTANWCSYIRPDGIDHHRVIVDPQWILDFTLAHSNNIPIGYFCANYVSPDPYIVLGLNT